MPKQPDKRIVDFLKEHHVLTLATSVENQSYCANCFYEYLEDDNAFVFSSDEDTRHIANVRQNNKVSASVVLETKTIGKIQGVQIVGEMITPEKEQLKKVNKAYLKRFPYAILKNTQLWVLNISYLKMTDNRLGFGKKIIWEK